ncbi:MAG: LytR/AlgR family response regulator transcription factor, partial [Blastocatellia bacterium]
MTDSKLIRVLIVDDEPLARRRLRELLKDDSEIVIVGECANGDETISDAPELEPDLIFLDVQMPGIDGLAVSEALNGKGSPLFVFVTAYEQYAVRAFDVQAVDYLLKPFDRARFTQALRLAKERLREKDRDDVNRRILGLLSEIKDKPQYLDR